MTFLLFSIDPSNVNAPSLSIHGNCYAFADRIASHKQVQAHGDTEVQSRGVYHNELHREHVDDATEAASESIGRRASWGRTIWSQIV